MQQSLFIYFKLFWTHKNADTDKFLFLLYFVNLATVLCWMRIFLLNKSFRPSFLIPLIQYITVSCLDLAHFIRFGFKL